jgi:hypothetical protein
MMNDCERVEEDARKGINGTEMSSGSGIMLLPCPLLLLNPYAGEVGPSILGTCFLAKPRVPRSSILGTP